MQPDLALLAERRAGLAALLGTLLLSEPGPSIAALVRDVPALAPLGSGDRAIAVEYERVFLRGVPLYESGFRSDDGQHGGAMLGAVMERYGRLGFTEHLDGRWRVGGADHLGLELRCYSMLCRQEAEAWRGGTPDESTRTVEAERTFLADHLSAWAPVALRAASKLAGDGVYRPLLDAAGEFLREEHDRLRPAPDVGVELPVDDLPTHLGPARLARLLLAPAACGAWLTTADIAVAAGAIGVPWRPSDTRTALRHVIESAADGAELGLVLEGLRPALVAAADAHAAGAAADPGNAAHWRTWEARVRRMLAVVDHIVEGGGLGQASPGVVETLVVSGADAAVVADAVDRAVAALRAAGLDVRRECGR